MDEVLKSLEDLGCFRWGKLLLNRGRSRSPVPQSRVRFRLTHHHNASVYRSSTNSERADVATNALLCFGECIYIYLRQNGEDSSCSILPSVLELQVPFRVGLFENLLNNLWAQRLGLYMSASLRLRIC